MKRFTLVAALATVVGLGLADTANAQYVQRYNYVTPYGGYVNSTSLYNLGTYRTFNTYVSPFGVRQQAYYNDIYGNMAGRASGYNRFNGLNYNSGFYNPSPLMYPFGGGYNYNFYHRW